MNSDSMDEEEKILTPYLSEDVQLKRITPIHVLWAMTKVTAWRNFTHHPTCNKYKNHYFKIRKFKLCVGCTGTYSGIGAFLILYFAVPSIQLNPIVLPIIFLIGFSSAVLHSLIHLKNKWLKAFLRFCLGFGIGAYIGIIIISPRWWLRGIFILILFGVIGMFVIIRGTEANLELCDDCSLHSANPPCDPMKNTDLRVKKINDIVDAQLDKFQKQKTTSLEVDILNNENKSEKKSEVEGSI